MKKPNDRPRTTLRARRIILVSLSFAVSFGFLVAFDPGLTALSGSDLESLEIGKVADRDIKAERDIVWIDEDATRLRREAEARLVLPIFVVDENEVNAALSRLKEYREGFADLSKGGTVDELVLKLQSAFPGAVPERLVRQVAQGRHAERVFSSVDIALEKVLSKGVVALPQGGLERFNPNWINLHSWKGGALAYDNVPIARLVTEANATQAVAAEIRLSGVADAELVAAIAACFIQPTAFFDADQSLEMVERAEGAAKPVVVRIQKGDTIIRKGFVVTATDVDRLRQAFASGFSFWKIVGDALALAFVFALAIILFQDGPRRLAFRDEAFLVVSGTAFAAAVSIAVCYMPQESAMPATVFVPVALFSIVVATLYGQRESLWFAIVLGTVAFIASKADAMTSVFTLLSGAAGAVVMRGTGTRIDLVRAGAELAGLSALACVSGAAFGEYSFAQVAGAALWCGLNGFCCAILSLALLPLLEQALNAPTVFRLMELSDLNAPAMKRLLTSAPGTYSHSITVAHLAESACRAIGANPLLARVGAYYHDIGKIEQPEYFVENQSGYNRHDDISPRLSATVIRSHVKLGVEKTRALKLPSEVIDIISQHHGNGLITFFFDRALKTDPDARADDFSYPGEPPTSREAAVVMLADATEAASRTIKNASMSRIDQLIRDITFERIRTGQFAACDITMKDLETVRDTFVRILAGNYHSRIEYPEAREIEGLRVVQGETREVARVERKVPPGRGE